MLFACLLAFKILPEGLWMTSISYRVSEVAGYVQSLHCSSGDHRREPGRVSETGSDNQEVVGEALIL